MPIMILVMDGDVSRIGIFPSRSGTIGLAECAVRE
jgi:hypothetical protein